MESIPLPAPHVPGGNSQDAFRGVGSKRAHPWVGVQCPLVAPRLAGRFRARRPDGCDSGVAPLQDCGRLDWGSVVGRATAQLITSCWESLSPARGDSPGGQAHPLSAGALVSKMNFRESACWRRALRLLPPPQSSRSPADPEENRRPRVAQSGGSLARCDGGTSSPESLKWGGKLPTPRPLVRHRVPGPSRS